MINAALLITVTLCLAGGQFLFKRAGLAIQGQTLVEGLVSLLRLPVFHAAVVLYACTTVLWVWVLSRVPLMRAYPWVACAAVLVPMIGWLAFNERVAPVFWLGMALILVGLLLTQYAAR